MAILRIARSLLATNSVCSSALWRASSSRYARHSSASGLRQRRVNPTLRGFFLAHCEIAAMYGLARPRVHCSQNRWLAARLDLKDCCRVAQLYQPYSRSIMLNVYIPSTAVTTVTTPRGNKVHPWATPKGLTLPSGRNRVAGLEMESRIMRSTKKMML
jgi:hypothetical protein